MQGWQQLPTAAALKFSIARRDWKVASKAPEADMYKMYKLCIASSKEASKAAVQNKAWMWPTVQMTGNAGLGRTAAL